MRELLTIYLETNGSDTSGVFGEATNSKFVCEWFYETPKYIRLPRGCKVKIWYKSFAAEGATKLIVEFTHDVTASSPTWEVIDEQYLPDPGGQLNLEKRRPIVIHAKKGTEAIRFSWAQPTAKKAYITIGLEIVDEVDNE